MTFGPLPERPPFESAEAQRYERNVLELSREVEARLKRIEESYGPDPWQRVDIYLPDRGARPAPVLLFLHGGGWIAGHKEWMAFMAPPFLDAGIAFVSVSYRLAPEHKYPACLDDTLAAIAFVGHNAGRLGVDAARLYVGGHSAGGHLSTLAALRRDLHVRHGLAPGAIRGCFPVSTTFAFRGEHLDGLAGRVLPDAGFAAEASPLTHVAAGAPPFLIAWGERDFERCRDTSREMAEALAAAGVEVETMEFPGHDHFDASFAMRDNANPWVQRTIGWMSETR